MKSSLYRLFIVGGGGGGGGDIWSIRMFFFVCILKDIYVYFIFILICKQGRIVDRSGLNNENNKNWNKK